MTRKAETVAAVASRQKYEKIRLSVDDLFGVAIAADVGVDRAVGDIRAIPSFEDLQDLPRIRMLPQLAQNRLLVLVADTVEGLLQGAGQFHVYRSL